MIDYAVKNVGLIKTGSKLEAEWLYYYLSSEIGKAHILALKSGSSQPYLTLGALRNFPVLVFEDDADKTGLVKVLSDIDAKIEVNNQINQQLETMAKTLYDYWFVQFDFPSSVVSSSAVENDLTSKNPKTVSSALDMTKAKTYKSAGGKMVYNEELKREIPEGWEVKPLTDEMDMQYGFPFSTKLFNDEEDGVAVIRIRDIKNCSISNYSTEDVDEKYKIEKGDILVGMDGNFHINYWIREDCYLNQRCLRIRFTTDSISAMQAKYMIEPYIKAREQNVSRTTVAHLSARDVNDLNVIVAPIEIQSKANKIFKSYLDKMVSNQVENQKLTELRDWLLPMLMNGQVKIKSVSSQPVQSKAEGLDLTKEDVSSSAVDEGVSSSAVENGYVQKNPGLARVAESGEVYGKSKKSKN